MMLGIDLSSVAQTAAFALLAWIAWATWQTTVNLAALKAAFDSHKDDDEKAFERVEKALTRRRR